jgi:hypothetical protein
MNMRIFFTVLTVGLFWVIAWLAGYNFDERTPLVAYWGILSLGAGAFVFSCLSK